MASLDGDDTLTGYYSKEMVSYKTSYSYRNYLEPILLKANDMAARNARDVAVKSLILAAVYSIISVILCR